MSEQQGVLEFRVSNLENAVLKIERAVESIDSSLKVLAQLEAHHAATREDLVRFARVTDDHETRLRKIEEEMPTVKIVNRWIMTGVVGIVGTVALALFKFIGI